jgi:hypothetical protein
VKSILKLLEKSTIINNEIYYIGDKFSWHDFIYEIIHISDDGIIQYIRINDNCKLWFKSLDDTIWNRSITKI